MKLRNLFTFLAFVFGITISSQGSSKYDSALAAYIKNEKFNLELYELSFCIEEILGIIESDSSYRKIFEKRVRRAFDKNSSEAQIYFHTLEFELFSTQVSGLKDVKRVYPKSLILLDKLRPTSKAYAFKSFAVPFQAYVEYPEQVDDACLIVLLSDLPYNIWNEIQSDELAIYRFNSWIEYGFEEFRFYPGIKSPIRATLNYRIIEFIKRKNKENKEPLVVKSMKMIDSVIAKYKK